MIGAPPPCPALAPFRNTVAAGAGIDRAIDAVQRGVRDFLARAAAGIYGIDGLKVLQCLFVSGSALALVQNRRSGYARQVGGHSPPYIVVPVQAERFECPQDVICRFRHAARHIESYQARQPSAVMMSRVEVAADGGSKGAEV